MLWDLMISSRPAGRATFSLEMFAVTLVVILLHLRPCSAGGEILLNSPLEVPLGRSVYVSPDTNLAINVGDPNDRCSVTVLNNVDPLAERPGMLMPRSFPCNFGRSDVYYTHFGARNPAEDSVHMQIRYDSKTETKIIPFTLTVKVIFVQLEIVTKNMPLVVDELNGLSTPIAPEGLEFTYEDTSLQCKVSILGPDSGLPRYGIIAKESYEITNQDCDSFLTSGIRYQHTAGTNSINSDHVPMVVELLNPVSGEVTNREYFQVMIRINAAPPNSAPLVGVRALLVMEVDQFVLTAITSEILSAEDRETSPDRLIFNITSSLPEGDGMVVSTLDQNQPLRSFTQRDIGDLKIGYRPPSKDADRQRMFQIPLQVVDEDGGTSDPFNLMVIVKPMNTLAPLVTKNTGLQLFEGQSRHLMSKKNLEISDEDNLKDVRISVLDGLRHGQLLGISNKFFTPADLDAGSIMYKHDGSDTYSDNIIFRMTDGSHTVEFLFPITIHPEDDESPILNVNTGLQIRRGDLVEINPFILSAADIDSDDASIKFLIQTPYSDEGTFVFRQQEAPVGEEWMAIDGFYEKPVTMWTQLDIMDGKLYYRHVGPHRTTSIMDRHKLVLSDSSDPPNVSGEQEFVIKVLPKDDQPPFLYPGITLVMEVLEYETTPFKRRHLRYTDLDTNDRQLKYVILQAPYDSDTNNPYGAGEIVLCDNPEVIVDEFTQAQVNHHKICYKPPNADLGLVKRLIQFLYKVEDTNGNEVSLQLFNIVLNPVDNQPPVVTNTGATIFENGQFVLTPSMISVSDPDTDSSRIFLNVTKLPIEGLLLLNTFTLNVGDLITLDDIDNGRVVYTNTGLEMNVDVFSFEVTDGIHRIPIDFQVTVRSIDDEAPKFQLPPGALGTMIDVLEGQSVLITSNTLSATDPDTENMMLTFILDDPPKYGRILLDGALTRSFKQRDIVNNLVTYRHVSGEIGPNPLQDSLNLSLSDMSDDFIVGGNTISKIQMTVNILPVDNMVPTVKVGKVVVSPEGGKQTITLDHLSATDVDTDDDSIVCTVVVQPNHGYLENSSPAPGSEKLRMGMPISAFSIGDIKSGQVNYVQSVHSKSEPREDRFVIRCSDGVNQTPQVFINIEITPANDEPPQLFLREFVVMEGSNLIIDLPILNAVDNDVPEDQLVFTITRQPEHGQIIRQTFTGTEMVTTFTMEEIRLASVIVYEHDNSETTSDSFTIHLTDGTHEITKEIPIVILPVDDETPRLTINNGLDIDIGEARVLTNEDLKAEDLDSLDPNITYVIRRQPVYGFLQKFVNNVATNLTRGKNFSQWEIDAGHIRYIHKGRQGVRDLIKFDVTDGLNPLIDRYFYVSVEGIDTTFPDVINKGVELPEGGFIILTTNILSTTDNNSPDQNLQFTITRAPTRGHLELTDFPGVPITSFTQLQLAGNKVKYVHTSDDEMKMDSFEFEVTDGYNPVFRTFRISLSDVDNKLPVLMTETLRVKEGGVKLITPFELRADDRDTADKFVRFKITRSPKHGKILYNNSRIVTSFTQEHLNENLITYKHDGSETLEDYFHIKVTDGKHRKFYIFPDTTTPVRKPQEVKIEVVSIDNGVPQMMINRATGSLDYMTGDKLGFLFTNKMVKAEDRDSPHNRLVFRVVQQPDHGYLINVVTGQIVTNWTQGEIDNKLIQYILKTGANATGDRFIFNVIDKGGNSLENQEFRLNWAWVSFDTPAISVNESDEHLVLTLNRQGFLGETSFVGIKVINGTAKLGLDMGLHYAHQVQFNPGERSKAWRLPLIQDLVYENQETFTLQLENPVLALIGQPSVATVTILDQDDESVVFFPEKKYIIEENAGEVLIPVRRTGDLSGELMVICSTVEDTAKGTVPKTVTSFSDYISRPPDFNSIVRFGVGEAEKLCSVKIIDDALYEDEEQFYVVLTSPMGGRIGEVDKAAVVIPPHALDEPAFFFDKPEYVIDESGGYLEVNVWRTGSDISMESSVAVRTRRTEPASAAAGLDYSAINKMVEFNPWENMKTVRITILDDLGQPRVEGEELFQLVLRMPSKGIMGEPSKAVVTINDTMSDLPTFEFKEALYTVNENDGRVITTIIRRGDISHAAKVRCFTRQGTAQVMMDYDERMDTDESYIEFQPGEVQKQCIALLMDDEIYEPEEQFRLVLGQPTSELPGGGKLGRQNYTVIKVKDDGDKPVIKFLQTRFTIREPQVPGDIAVVTIPVVREGDLSQTSIVRVHTKDGSAKAGTDYMGFSRELEFSANISRIDVQVEVMYDKERELREVLTVHLRNDKNLIADIKNKKATVYIEEVNKLADVTFPSTPMVVSLKDYDSVKTAGRPVPGYPVICITACDPRYPDFAKTGPICAAEGINDTMTRFRWRLSAPTGTDGVTSGMRDVAFTTFFTSPYKITLDSIYFGAGSRVQCAARAVNANGDIGLETSSNIVSVATDQGICEPRVSGSVGAEPFTSKVKYTGPDDPDHPNMVQVSVTIPHRDGMLPIISTRQLSNFEIILSPDGLRLGQHKCSNLLDYEETTTRAGFITSDIRNAGVVGEVEPYQYNSNLRSEKALRFYRNLDMEACLWNFVSYYDMSELITDCGGSIDTDGQVRDVTQSYVSVTVPLYVSYVFHSPVALGGWQNNDLSTQLKLQFVYDTAILWQDGIGAEDQSSDDENSGLQGYLYPTSMRINSEGRLVVNFRTEARFRGLFVPTHPGTSVRSVVTSENRPQLTFTLELLRSEPTYAQPEQSWEFTSDLAVRDYSGMYKISLIPCTVPLDQSYSLPVTCNPRELMNFDLQIRFQQVSDPVAAEYSLNTQFYLIRQRGLWLSDGSNGLDQSDSSFGPDDQLYGRIMVNPVQSLGGGFQLNIEKVFLCTGKDGYVPKYDPSNQEFGCLAESPKLLHTFKVLDRRAPSTVTVNFRDVPFNAKLAVDEPAAQDLLSQAGNDGFMLDTKPMFQVDSGRQWFLHSIYAVRSQDSSRVRRSIDFHTVVSALSSPRHKRAVEDSEGIGKDGQGTNMAVIKLDSSLERLPDVLPTLGGVPVESSSKESGNGVPLVPIVVASAAVLVIALVVVLAVICWRRRGLAEKIQYSSNGYNNCRTEAASQGRSRVVLTKTNNTNNSEV